MTRYNVTLSFDDGKLAKWPKKVALKFEALKFLYTKFENEKHYSEKEVNDILDKCHTFDDAPMLRRSLIDQGFMKRERDGSKYWLNADVEAVKEYKIA
jgi:hypothetical protein